MILRLAELPRAVLVEALAQLLEQVGGANKRRQLAQIELLALRRLTTSAFGTLMALEPAFAMIVGLIVLHQMPGIAGVVGITVVVAAGIGAARSGARTPSPVPAEVNS